MLVFDLQFCCQGMHMPAAVCDSVMGTLEIHLVALPDRSQNVTACSGVRGCQEVHA
jgi:hypothetical protein